MSAKVKNMYAHSKTRIHYSKVIHISELIVDAVGLFCPEPIVRLGKAIKTIADGETLILRADDPSAKSDVESWAELSGNELVSVVDTDEYVEFLIKRKA